MNGQLTIFSRHVRTGHRAVIVKTHNLILNQMYQQLVDLLGGGRASYVNRMQLGTGTITPAADQVQLQRPITPILNMTAQPGGGFGVVSETTVTFSAFLLQHEGNGFPLSEAALMTVDGLIVARAVFGTTRTKTTDYQFGFEWAVNVRAP